MPNSESVENTLEKYRQMAKQSQPPTARPNPRAGGQPQGGGSPQGNDTAALSEGQARVIGDQVRECWNLDLGMLGVDRMHVLLTVTTDAVGTARQAAVSPEDQGRLADPRFRSFAERARRAVLSPQCANLPVPKTMLGKVNTFTFRFSP